MDKEEKIKCLREVDFTLNESKVLLWLLRNKKGVSRMIEHEEDLRQSEVSVVMSRFEKMGWIIYRNIRKGGKGRPEKEYIIEEGKLIFASVISDLEKKQSKINDMIKKLEEEYGHININTT